MNFLSWTSTFCSRAVDRAIHSEFTKVSLASAQYTGRSNGTTLRLSCDFLGYYFGVQSVPGETVSEITIARLRWLKTGVAASCYCRGGNDLSTININYNIQWHRVQKLIFITSQTLICRDAIHTNVVLSTRRAVIIVL